MTAQLNTCIVVVPVQLSCITTLTSLPARPWSWWPIRARQKAAWGTFHGSLFVEQRRWQRRCPLPNEFTHELGDVAAVVNARVVPPLVLDPEAVQHAHHVRRPVLQLLHFRVGNLVREGGGAVDALTTQLQALQSIMQPLVTYVSL